MQNRLEDAVRLLELDRGQDKNHTNELMDNINTLKDTIQARNDYEEEKAIRTKNSGLAVLVDFEKAFDSVSF